MNSVYWHLVLNHIPIFGTVFGLLILGYGSLKESHEIQRLALALLVIAGIAVVPVYYSGHNAEEIAEELSGVTEHSIEHHEELAETSYYLTLALGLVSLGGILQSFRKTKLSQWFLLLVGLLGIVTVGSLLRTADAGGKIRHPEIQVESSTHQESEHEHNHSHD